MAVLIAILLTGCQTPQSFPQPGAQWQTHVGQLQYVSGQSSVIGDVVVRRLGSSEFQLDFQSGPGFPLMRLKQSGERARAEGVLARGVWQGDASRAPEQLQGWVKLRESLGRQPLRQRVTVSPAPGERFAFAFAN